MASLRPQRWSNAREMLIAAGLGQFTVTMSLPYIYFPARACDPYTQGVMQIVQALQNVINARGGHLEITGWVNPPTAAAIRGYAGVNWRDKSWLQLLGDVMERSPPRPAAPPPAMEPAATSGLGSIEDVFYSPVALVAAGAAAFWMFGKKKRARA